MAFFGRQVLAIGTAAILLIVQALPSLAVCVCGKETAMSCCSTPEKPASSESHCRCNSHPTEKARPGHCRATAESTPRDHLQRLSPSECPASATAMAGSECRKIDVGPNLTSAGTPEPPHVLPLDLDGGVVVLPEQWKLPSLDRRFPYAQMRGPPPDPPGQIYLLHSAFLL